MIIDDFHVVPCGFARFKVFAGRVLADGVTRRVAEQLANNEITPTEANRISEIAKLGAERAALRGKIEELQAKLTAANAPPYLHEQTCQRLTKLDALTKELAEIDGRLLGLEDEMRRRHDDGVPAVPPGAGLVLVARREIRTSSKIFPVGSCVPVEALGRNFSALLSNHFVEFRPPTKSLAKPRDLPAPPAPPQGNPKVEIVSDPDVVVSWRKTLASMAEKTGGDFGRAHVLLMGDDKASEIYRRATRVDCLQRAKRQGVQSVSPQAGF